MNGWRVILQVQTPARGECVTFGEVPSLDPAHIAVYAEAGPAASVAHRLFDELRRQVSPLAPAEACGGPRLLGCKGRHEPSCRSLLVVVTGASRISRDLVQLIKDWLTPGPLNAVVLPVLPAGADPAVVFPPPFDRLTALFNYGSPETLAPDVLRSARLGGEDHRLFLSYRRKDAQDLAEQLHDAFARKGFRVFLDRFTGTPGRAFPRELAEELADKSVVLVIESPKVSRSPWTLAEVAFASRLHLGLFALQMPGGPRFAVVSDRFDATRPGLWRRTSEPRLTDSARDDVVDFVRRGYLRQRLARRVFLEGKLKRALSPTALAAAEGMFEAAGYVVHLADRPPALNDVRRPLVRARARRLHPVIVGPVRLLPPHDESDLRWLAGDAKLSLADEGNMRRMARRMKQGRIPL